MSQAKSLWEWRGGAWWLRVKRDRLNSRHRRKVQRGVMHISDEERIRRSEG